MDQPIDITSQVGYNTGRAILRKERLVEITGFIWHDDLVEKIEVKHHVEQDEVRELFANQPQFRRVEKGHRPGEHVYSAAGQTDAGRYLMTYFVYKRNRRALVLSARDMTAAERRRHERR